MAALRLFPAASGGAAVCETVAAGVSVTAGRFRVPLADPDCVGAVASNPDLWIEATIEAATLPRAKMGAVPYALEAGRASRVGSTGREELVATGQSVNCALALDGASLTIVGRDSAPLSPDNACLVGIHDRAVRRFDTPVSVAFGDDPNTFGSTAAGAWNYDRPFFVAACDGAAHDYFGISLNPVRGSTGSDAAMLCRPGGTTRCNSQGSLLLLVEESVALTGETNRPCVVVGSFRATKSATDQWTVTALDPAKDGFGRFQEGVRFTMPSGQNGAAPGSYFSSSGGTPPSWPVIAYYYWVFRSGMVRLTLTTDDGVRGSDCTNGTGTGWTMLGLPYVPASASPMVLAGWVRTLAGPNDGTGMLDIRSSSLAYIRDEYCGAIPGSGWSSASDIIAGDVEYPAFSP